MKHTIYLLFGSNIGDRERYIHDAIELLKSKNYDLLGLSRLYESDAWGNVDQQAFLNRVGKFQSHLAPKQVLQDILRSELELGRERQEKWGPRKIDIDLLYYNNLVLDEPDLKIPHPGIPSRKFTLVPLNDLDPDLIHPQLKKSNQDLLNECKDTGGLRIFKPQLAGGNL